MIDVDPDQLATMQRQAVEIAETPVHPLAPEVTRYLAMMRSIRPPIPKGWVYRGAEDFLLQHGQAYPAPKSARPRGVRKMTNKYCFDNAYRIACLEGWTYVEGYAAGFFPMHHAWCVRPDGRVIDVTWGKVGTEYFGVPFPLDQMKAIRTETNTSMLLQPKLYTQRFDKSPVKV